MDVDHGGRVTLRLAAAGSASVEYDASLEAPGVDFTARAVIALPSGSVEIRPVGGEPPEWLVELARTTLRGAFRASRTGTPWPRRLSRWRGGPGETDP